MATILPFVIRRKPAAAPRRAAGDALIIIFPGVRYEPVRGKGAAPRPRADGPQRKRKSKSS